RPERAHARQRRTEPDGGARAARPRRAAARGNGRAPAHAANRRAHARHPGADVSGNRRCAEAAARHGQVAHQPGTNGTRAPDSPATVRTLQSKRVVNRPLTHGSILMKVTTEQSGGITIVRVGETRIMYSLLGD